MIDPTTRVHRAITHIVLKHPFYAGLALRLDPFVDGLNSQREAVEDKRVKRIVANGKILRFNPEWVSNQDGDELITHVAGCVTRCALSHHTRREGRDPADWQIASSIVVNGILAKSGYRMPADARMNPDLENLSVEKVYSVIHKDGDQNGQDGQDGPVEDSQGAGGVADAQSDDGGPLSESEKAAEENAWSVAAIQAANIGQSFCGDVPDAFKRIVDEIKAPADDCWSVLRSFVQQSCERDDQTWSRPSRRHHGFDVIMPGKKSESLGQIVVGADTSCSINERILSELLGHIQAVQEDYQPESVKIVFGDTRLRGGPVNLDRGGDFDTSQIMRAAVGGGGTKLDWPFQWVDEYAEADPVCMIMLTDLEAPALTVPPPCYPVLWGVTPGHGRRMEPAFGEIVELS